jgi:hypothetical protein
VGFVRCSDCAVELVDHLPVDAPSHSPVDVRANDIPRDFETEQLELVVIRTFQSGLDADLAKAVLDAAGIESIVRNDGGVGRHYLGLALTQGIDLLVRSEDAEDADKLLDIDVTGEDNSTD